MYGIHEASIARIVVGWVIVLAYLGHIVVLGLGYKAQQRVWRIVGRGKADNDVEMTHGEARVVVVRFEEEDTERARALAKEANVI